MPIVGSADVQLTEVAKFLIFILFRFLPGEIEKSLLEGCSFVGCVAMHWTFL